MEILFGLIVIALLVLILASVLYGEEGFAATAMAGLGCLGVALATVVSIVVVLIIIIVMMSQ